jgi:predicted branched-subunit amino acid permease
MAPPPFTFAGVRRGFLMAQPLAPGVLVYGLIFGVMAAEAKLSTLEAVLMSAVVYSGSAQMAALQSWSAATLILPLAATILVMNARYLLYGAALWPWMGRLDGARVYPSLFLLGDANWALSLREYSAGRDDVGFVFGSGFAMYVPWVAGTAFGHLGGSLVNRPGQFGFDFILVAVSAASAAAMWRGREIGRAHV